jgi:ATP-dependent Clp protease, protease subunit
MKEKKKKNKKKTVEEEAPRRTLHIMSFYGPVDEERCEEAINAMLTGDYDENSSIKLIISTCGGLATEMFGLYDVIRNVREDLNISTVGLGKVMSAGVLLLASGTKGNRKIGKHCKVMIHNLQSDMVGSPVSIGNDLDELKRIEEMYIKALSKETNMSKKYIKKLFNKKVDIYLTAKEAVELGIADEVI